MGDVGGAKADETLQASGCVGGDGCGQTRKEYWKLDKEEMVEEIVLSWWGSLGTGKGNGWQVSRLDGACPRGHAWLARQTAWCL